MARMTTAEAQGRLAELAERVRATGERLALTEGGETVAVLVPLLDVEVLGALEDRADAALAAERLAEWERTGESYSHDEVFRGLLDRWLGGWVEKSSPLSDLASR